MSRIVSNLDSLTSQMNCSLNRVCYELLSKTFVKFNVPLSKFKKYNHSMSPSTRNNLQLKNYKTQNTNKASSANLKYLGLPDDLIFTFV